MRRIVIEETSPDLEPMLQAYFDIACELDPDSNADQFTMIRKGIKYCIETGQEPLEALEGLRTPPEPALTYKGIPITNEDYWPTHRDPTGPGYTTP